MPPRYSYWTIIAGGLPTAFRAADRNELLPTFNRLREKHPDAEMKWFARGKLWDSPEEARATRLPPAGLDRPGERQRRFRPRDESGGRRGRDWRPGGEHRDPRQTFKDAKKLRNQAHRQKRWERKHSDTDKPNATGPTPEREFRPKAHGPGPKRWTKQTGTFVGRPKFGSRKPWGKDRPEGEKPRPPRTGRRPPRPPRRKP